MGLVATGTNREIRGLELSAHPRKRQGPKDELTKNNQLFTRPCLCNETSIQSPYVMGSGRVAPPGRAWKLAPLPLCASSMFLRCVLSKK